jgi:hypothetical protein
MKGLGTSALALGFWWRIAVALSAALAVDASLTDNRTLAFVTVALTAALMVYAGAAMRVSARAAEAISEDATVGSTAPLPAPIYEAGTPRRATRGAAGGVEIIGS